MITLPIKQMTFDVFFSFFATYLKFFFGKKYRMSMFTRQLD